jgi:ribonuclease T2
MGSRHFLLFGVGIVLTLIQPTSADFDPKTSSSVSPIKDHSDPGFDLLLLVRTWPPTFCEELKEVHLENCTAPPLQEFTLHGLWPEYSSGGWPQYCPFSHTVEEDDDIKFRCEWPSFHGSTLSFWDHEWEKHGSCAAPLLGNRTEYFKTVVDLHDKFNLNHVFRSNRLWPVGNSQGMFTTTEAVNAVEQAFPGAKQPRLACNKGSLSEVWICLDVDLKAVECPAKVKPGQMCGTQFRMPPGTQPNGDCQQFYPGEGRNWGQYLRWPAIIGIFVLLGSIISAVLVELERKRRDDENPATYEPLGEA